jgi:hypothetical protein
MTMPTLLNPIVEACSRLARQAPPGAAPAAPPEPTADQVRSVHVFGVDVLAFIAAVEAFIKAAGPTVTALAGGGQIGWLVWQFIRTRKGEPAKGLQGVEEVKMTLAEILEQLKGLLPAEQIVAAVEEAVKRVLQEKGWSRAAAARDARELGETMAAHLGASANPAGPTGEQTGSQVSGSQAPPASPTTPPVAPRP